MLQQLAPSPAAWLRAMCARWRVSNMVPRMRRCRTVFVHKVPERGAGEPPLPAGKSRNKAAGRFSGGELRQHPGTLGRGNVRGEHDGGYGRAQSTKAVDSNQFQAAERSKTVVRSLILGYCGYKTTRSRPAQSRSRVLGARETDNRRGFVARHLGNLKDCRIFKLRRDVLRETNEKYLGLTSFAGLRKLDQTVGLDVRDAFDELNNERRERPEPGDAVAMWVLVKNWRLGDGEVGPVTWG
ncbi:hypothetical protein C8R47DRAFT_1073597 [Mycena vitilis]|nr:hypothetical protein C8R47DRAFT_1073597 [Mycena vitilis]